MMENSHKLLLEQRRKVREDIWNYPALTGFEGLSEEAMNKVLDFIARRDLEYKNELAELEQTVRDATTMVAQLDASSALFHTKLLNAEEILHYIAVYELTGTEQTLHIDFQGKARTYFNKYPEEIKCSGYCVGTDNINNFIEDLTCPVHGIEAQEKAREKFPDREAWLKSLQTKNKS